MPDFNTVLAPGDYQNAQVNTVCEIPKGSTLKIEWDRQRAAFMIDRVEPAIFAKPTSYGFIPGTLDDDGDELDTLIICDQPIPTGVYLSATVIGVLEFEDDGEMDHKVVVVPADDRHTGDAIKSLDDLPRQLRDQIVHHFTHYKDLKKPGSTKVLGWGDTARAVAIIGECIVRYDKKL